MKNKITILKRRNPLQFSIITHYSLALPMNLQSMKSILNNEIQDIKMELIEMEEADDKESSSQGLDQIWQDHETLVNIILQEEEDLLASHRKYIDDVVESV